MVRLMTLTSENVTSITYLDGISALAEFSHPEVQTHIDGAIVVQYGSTTPPPR